MNYVKALILFITTVLILTFIYSLINYFNLIDTNKYFNLIIIFISTIISGIYIGLKSKNKGYLEGLKISILLVGILLLTTLIFKSDLNIKRIFYFLTVISTTTLGSILGINKKKTNN